MNPSRRLLTLGALACALGACATPALYAYRPRKKYQEAVSSLLMTPDGKQLVVIGADFHYIFPIPGEIRSLIASPYRKYIQARFGEFELGRDGLISGYCYLVSAENALPDGGRRELRAQGIYIDHTDEGSLINWSGKRYQANGIEASQPRQRLNKEYQITINSSDELAKTTVRLLGTPITVTADGVLVLATLPLTVPLFIMLAHNDWHGMR